MLKQQQQQQMMTIAEFPIQLQKGPYLKFAYLPSFYTLQFSLAYATQSQELSPSLAARSFLFFFFLDHIKKKNNIERRILEE